MQNVILTKRKSGGAKEDTIAYLFLAPSLVISIIFLIVPIFIAVKLSFTNASLLTMGKEKFIGFSNYIEFFRSESFSKVFKATLVYVVGGVSLTYLMGLLFALLLNNPFKGRAIARSIAILPWAVPQVVLVLIWKWMLNPQNGVINFVLESLHMLPYRFSWFGDPKFGMLAILLATVWKQYPLAYLILLAGLQSIPIELYEAASVDGAGKLQKFIHITLPGLRYVTLTLVLLLVIWSFGNFTIVWLMTQGGPADKTATLTVFTYLNAFKFSKLGAGAAVGTICLIISLIFSVFYYTALMRQSEGE